MSTTILSRRGQITVPAAVRADLGLQPGDRVLLVKVAQGRYELIAINQPVTALKGIFGKPRMSLTIDEMIAINSPSMTSTELALARTAESQTNKRRVTLGLLKGRLDVPDDFDAPLPDDVLKGFGGS